MTKMRRRILAIILVGMLILSLLPIGAAFAAPAEPTIVSSTGSTSISTSDTVDINASTTVDQAVYYTISTNGGAGITPTTDNGFIYSAPFHLPVGKYTVEAAVYDPVDGWSNPDTVTYAVTLPVGATTTTCAIAGSGYDGYSLRSDGTVSAWGLNDRAELGNNSTVSSNVPVQVYGLTGITVIAAGKYESVYALRSDGSVWAWGLNSFGCLGNNSEYYYSNVPEQVYGLSGVTAIASGSYNGYAVKSDGTVWAWGYDGNDELGNGTLSLPDYYSDVPVQVSNLTGVVAVAAGDSFACALKSDGTVWAWGQGGGQLGNGSNSGSEVPVQVSNLSGVIAIAAGDGFTLALKSDGSVWAWGYQELYDGTVAIASDVPVQVSGLSNVTAIACGDTTGYALESDGTVKAWWGDYYGELGNGQNITSDVPVQVSGLNSITAIAGGDATGYAMKSDGTIWAWGTNADGQLGNGSTAASNVPVQVCGLNLLAPSLPSLAISSQTGSSNITSLTPISITATPALSASEAVYWNTTGFPLTTSGHLYQGAFTLAESSHNLSESSTVYAAVYDSATGQWSSQAAAFTVAGPAEPSIVSSTGFNYISTADTVGINATITSVDQAVYYTVGSGTTPTVNSLVYSHPFSLAAGTNTIEAAVYDCVYGVWSPAASATFSASPSVISENGLSVSNITDNSVTVSWPQIIGAVKYNVNVGVAQSFSNGGFNETHVISDLYSQVDASTTTYTITGLIGLSGRSNTSYIIEVDAVDASGNVPLPGTGPSADINISGEFNPPTTPVWPNGRTVKASDITETGASLTWTPVWNVAYDFGSNARVSYAVYNGDNLIGTTGNNSFDISDLSPDNSYNFYVKASYGEIWADGPSTSVVTASSSPASVLTISVGAQNGTLVSGVASTAAFVVTTTNISDGTPIAVDWCDSDGNSVPAPTGLSVTGTKIASNASTITVTATTSAVESTYYFKAVSDTATSNIVTVTVSPAAAKSLTGIGATTGTTQVGDTLTAGGVTPVGATATYQWQKCATSNGTYTPISNATASTYTLASNDLNMYLEVVATGANGYTGSETSAPVGRVTTASSSGGGGGGASPPSQPITSTTGTASVDPAAGGTVYLGTQASVAIPANALNGSQNVTVNVQSVSSPPAPPDGDTLVGAYGFTVNGGGYSFNAPVTLTFTFDPSKIPVGDTPTVEYYDNKTSQWVVVQGTVSGNTIMVTVSHFTTFAVMAVPQTTGASPAPTTVTPAVPSFSDVPSSYWGYQAITSLSAKGIVSGYPDGTFKPNNNITRAEFATMLVKATGLSTTSTSTSFTDITPSDWCYNSVNTAVYAGMVSGMGNGLFAPNAPITREQMVVMVAKAMGNKAPNIDGTQLNAFGDESSVSSWAVTGMEKSIKAGIVSGMTANILSPQDNATRSQAAVMIYRLLNVLGK